MIHHRYDIHVEATGFGNALDIHQTIIVQGTKIMHAATFLGRKGLFSMWLRGIPVAESLTSAFMNCIRVQLLLTRQNNSLNASAFYNNTANSTETGQHSNFIGEVFSEVVAQEHLGVIKLIHLEQFAGNRIGFLPGSRKRPDFLGQNQNGDWLVVEAKGTRSDNNKIEAKHRQQALSISSVDNVPTLYNCVSKTYFDGSLKVILENIPVNQGVLNLLGLETNNLEGLNIGDQIRNAFDSIRNNENNYLDESVSIDGLEGLRVRFFREEFFPRFRGLHVSIGILEELLDSPEFEVMPRIIEGGEESIEVFADGTVVRLSGEIEEG